MKTIKCQTIYKIYNYYIKSNKNDYLISKRYYEMYIKYYLSEYEDDGFIKEIWFLYSINYALLIVKL